MAPSTRTVSLWSSLQSLLPLSADKSISFFKSIESSLFSCKTLSEAVPCISPLHSLLNNADLSSHLSSELLHCLLSFITSSTLPESFFPALSAYLSQFKASSDHIETIVDKAITHSLTGPSFCHFISLLDFAQVDSEKCITLLSNIVNSCSTQTVDLDLVIVLASSIFNSHSRSFLSCPTLVNAILKKSLEVLLEHSSYSEVFLVFLMNLINQLMQTNSLNSTLSLTFSTKEIQTMIEELLFYSLDNNLYLNEFFSVFESFSSITRHSKFLLREIDSTRSLLTLILSKFEAVTSTENKLKLLNGLLCFLKDPIVATVIAENSEFLQGVFELLVSSEELRLTSLKLLKQMFENSKNVQYSIPFNSVEKLILLLPDDNSFLNNEKLPLSDENLKLVRKLVGKSIENLEISHKSQDIDLVFKENSSLKSRVEILEAQNAELTAQHRETSHQNTLLTSKVTQLEEKTVIQGKFIEQLQETNKELTSSKNDLKSSETNLTERLATLTKSLDSITDLSKRLRSECDELQNNQPDFSSISVLLQELAKFCGVSLKGMSSAVSQKKSLESPIVKPLPMESS
ncbi:hypothetical protein GEMRC1_002379 [Eukaryota sp. GEM-RC1]